MLLNLIANGFYAATRHAANRMDGYEPTVAAVTRNLGESRGDQHSRQWQGHPGRSERRCSIRSSRPNHPGKGTGLGLSLSHDIVVKQHAGSIEVNSQLGDFTKLTIVLPRKAVTNKQGEMVCPRCAPRDVSHLASSRGVSRPSVRCQRPSRNYLLARSLPRVSPPRSVGG